ncbi:MAG: hypothetical protein OJF59_002786 [Cytophagales bacterium]|jgi:intracellular sulfur oxidation DsrE/DsrF family protein|nr:Tat (twin-arginine translocation) pathway signal sequence containing protein [Bacteroidota bacterium]MBS1982231.1 Tat (twin-arginine translocation) pathway signal sequence containing protein [Bacteroidota bacterium]WHZ09032.1 MAG: hypothetical protein OJF59_002786 [Cytophagales bacterium]
MKTKTNPRREFLEKLAVGSTLVLPTLMASLESEATPLSNSSVAENADEWFNQVKGKHKIVYDATEPNEGFPVIWSWVFYKSNNETGTPDNQMTAMVVLRHRAISLAMQDSVWEKYKFGEVFNVTDGNTKAPATKNIYLEPTDPRMVMLKADGIKALMERGVMFCVCGMAIAANSMRIAKAMNVSPEKVKKEWMDGIIPGIQVVPSGVWAVGRAQEHGCAYCYAG